MKKSLFFALAVVSTLTCISPAYAKVTTNQLTISNNKQVTQANPADRGKPSNPIPAGRR
ncbi:hypothetical protein [Iningainema tapete]|uniref:Uncharacterized protein n=1 Tax=Iningainema tapete BLCC-T55 TaxID=2748662 RepID=A0A8J6XFN7_9CYAN|nr:hypothetical protein [Iningainema tapete]MBD2771326.1 hypothetical protein [Iningainema tapete BLCC-T55]